MRVEEYAKNVAVHGYRLREPIDPKAFIEAARSAADPVVVQFLDADFLAGERHLFFAALNALKSFVQGRNVAQTFDIEILLYASTQRQIGEAIRTVGLRPSTSALAAVLVGDSVEAVESAVGRVEPLIPGDRDNSVLEEIGEEKLATLMRTYDIVEAELEALSRVGSREAAAMWLVVERVALLDAER